MSEKIEADVFGSVIHAVVETIYKPFVGAKLVEEDLKKAVVTVEEKIIEAFKEHHSEGNVFSGKNLLSLKI